MPDPSSDIKKFYKDYLSSPNYKKRLIKQGYTNPEETTKQRLKQVLGTKVVDIPENTDVPVDTQFFPNINQIDVNLKQIKGLPYNSTLSHEFGHAAGALESFNTQNPNLRLNDKEANAFKSKNIYKDTEAFIPGMSFDTSAYINHEKKPSENKADLDMLRYKLYKDKIYDTGKQDFNQDILNKVKTKYSKDPNFKRFFGEFKDKDLIDLMNNVAINEQQDTPIAKNGGTMKKKILKAEYGALLDEYGNPIPNDIPPRSNINPQSIAAIDQKSMAGEQISAKDLAPHIQGAVDSAKQSAPKKTGISMAGNHPSLDVGAFLQGGIGAINALLGPEQPRRRINDELNYNPYPQGTGSSALAKNGKTIMEDGGVPPKRKAGAKKYSLTDELRSHANDPIELDNGKTSVQLAQSAGKTTGISPDLLLASGWQEGMNKAVIHPDQVSQGYADNEKNLAGYPVDGFLNYGVDRIGDNYNNVKKYLPNGFESKMKTYKTTNEKGQPVTTAAFDNNEDALTAKGAMMMDSRNGVQEYTKKKGIRLSNNDLDYFNLASYNYGASGAQGMLDEFQKSPHQDRFVQDGLTSKKGVHKNIMPRMDNIPQADNLINGTLYPGIGGQDDRYSINNKPVGPDAKNGKTIVGPEMQGLQTYDGGNAPQVSYNPIDGGMGEFKGDSHANGGIQSTFNGKPFEAEGGEPYRMDGQGNLEIFGNLHNPLTGNKFKKDAKAIATKEAKVQTYLDKGTELVNITDPGKDKFDLMKFNSGQAMMKGGLAKQKELAQSKEHLSTLQKIMLEQEGEHTHAGDGGVFADGGTPGDDKPWQFKGTKKDKLDAKIKGFVDLVQAKGLEGYSGEKSGYDLRNTKSGHPSRHSTNQALDMIFKDKDAYAKILKDPELSSYLYNNGLTAINEYDPSVASKTGATIGHLHIGYDKGTKTSDQFRNDYKAAYNPTNNPTLIPNTGRLNPSNPVGDAYTEIQPVNTPDYQFNNQLGAKPKQNTNYTQPTTKQFDFKQPTNTSHIPQTKFPWEQIAPVIPQVFDQPDFVERQSYQPDLYTPYQVSFQDRINQNSKNFNALVPSLVNNAEAQGSLAGQLYSANDAVLADEFRTNQGISNDITNKNVSLLNDAKLKNIQLADTQYVRQAQAKANTKDRRIAAGIQIGDIIAKNKLENANLAVTSQLYKDYAYDKNYQLQYVGDENAGDRLGESSISGGYANNPKSTEVTTVNGNTRTKQIYKPDFDFGRASLFKKYKNGGKPTQSTFAKMLHS